MKKFISMLLAMVLVLSTMFTMVACNGNDGNDGTGDGGSGDEYVPDKSDREPDLTKTQLIVSNYNGGYGEDWLYVLRDRFEAAYANTSFEEGKMGVELVIHSDKNGYSSTDLYNKMSITTDEIFFSEYIYYMDYVSAGYVLDITDIVTAVNTDGKTIQSKIDADYNRFIETDGKYYALPHYASFAGIAYDIDLFDAKKLYFAKNGAPSESGYTGTLAYTNLAGERSAGPDGTYGTDDDGLPATYDEFFALCGYMQTRGITPIAWNGQYNTTYIKQFLACLTADYEGAEQTLLNFTFDGTATNLGTISGGQFVEDATDTVITLENGYEIYRTAGRYYALSFLEQILDGSYYADCGFDGGASHSSTQTEFLRSSQKGEPIAMLIEGVWWENEAKDTFTMMESRYGEEYSRANRRLGFMAFPKATADKVGEGVTLLDANYSMAFINSKIPESKIYAAKTFLQFCYTDESLQEFTKVTGLPKALNYDMPEGVEFKSVYAEQVWNLYRNADVVYPVASNKIFLSGHSAFTLINTFVTATENSALKALYDGVSATKFFEGIVSLKNKEQWERNYSKYFE